MENLSVSVSQIMMDQLNPGLRNLVNLGKSYEKAVTGNTQVSPSRRLSNNLIRCKTNVAAGTNVREEERNTRTSYNTVSH